MGAVDRVSEIEHLRLITISVIVGDTWMHQGPPIKIGRAKDDEIMGLWDCGIVAHNHWAIAAVVRSSPNQMAFPYKMVFFPLCILTLD